MKRPVLILLAGAAVAVVATPLVLQGMDRAGRRAAIERSNAAWRAEHRPKASYEPVVADPDRYAIAVACAERDGVVDQRRCADAQQEAEAFKRPPVDYEDEVAKARLEPEGDRVDGAH